MHCIQRRYIASTSVKGFIHFPGIPSDDGESCDLCTTACKRQNDYASAIATASMQVYVYIRHRFSREEFSVSFFFLNRYMNVLL